MSEKPLKERFPKLKGFKIFEEKSKNFLKKIGESLESFITDVFDSAVYTLFPRLKNSETKSIVDRKDLFNPKNYLKYDLSLNLIQMNGKIDGKN